MAERKINIWYYEFRRVQNVIPERYTENGVSFNPELHTFSNAVLMQAIREAGYAIYQRNIDKIIGSLFLPDEKIMSILADPSELFAYSLETAMGGGNEFADILLEVTKRCYAEFI